MARGPLPRGLRQRTTKGCRVQYGFNIVSQWLPGGQCRSWLPVGTMREQAEKQLREKREEIEIARGTARGDVSLISFAAVAKDYVDELRAGGCTVDSVREAARRVRNLNKRFGDMPVMAILPEEIKAFRNESVKPPLGTGTLEPVTVNGLLGFLFTIFEHAIHVKRLIRFNPANARAVARLPVEDAEDGSDLWLVHPRDDARLIGSLPSWNAAAAAIALYIGPRRGAIHQLRLDDVDLIARTVRFRGSTLKRSRRKPRKTIYRPIPSRALFYITEQVKAARAVGSPWLFPSPLDPDTHMSADHISRTFREHAEVSGFSGAYFHGLRHNYVTRMKKAGLADVEERAHRDTEAATDHSRSASRIYTHLDDDAEAFRPIYDKMDRWLDTQEKLAQDSPRIDPKLAQEDGPEGPKSLQ